MVKNLKIRLILIVIVIAASIYAFWPPQEKIKLGLDLKGGMHLVLEVKVDKVVLQEVAQYAERAKSLLSEKKISVGKVYSEGEKVIIEGIPENSYEKVRSLFKDYFSRDFDFGSHFAGGKVTMTMKLNPLARKQIERETVQQSLETLERRINQYGVAEPSLQLYGSGRDGVPDEIIVELPGVDNPEEVKSLLKETASLSLNLVYPNAPYGVSKETIMKFFKNQIPDGYKILPVEGGGYAVVQKAPVITGKHLTNAKATLTTELGIPKHAVSFTLNSEGARKFAKATGDNIGRRLAIVLDNKIISAPEIKDRISDSGVISGNFTQRDAELLALNLRSGALPADIVILEERTIGPSLGWDSIQRGIKAALLGLVLVIVLMLIYYKLSGLNAVFCLLINLIILLGALGYFRGTLTLPGIAGIILTIGMAVDSNVLIFERIKEELRLGKTVASAVEAGFSKASLTIFDANITTLIAAAFLYQYGTGPIKGFAVTLTAGLLANLFAAIFVSKTVFQFVLDWKKVKKLSI